MNVNSARLTVTGLISLVLGIAAIWGGVVGCQKGIPKKSLILGFLAAIAYGLLLLGGVAMLVCGIVFSGCGLLGPKSY